MRTHRLSRLTGVLAALSLLAAACSSGADDSGSADPGTDPSNDVSTESPDEAEEAASDSVDEIDGSLTVYSGRSEELVGHLFDEFAEATGVDVQVRYGNTAELAVTILEEGTASPADLYFGQDAGALGALETAGRFVALPDDILTLVDEQFRSSSDGWIGITGRVRVLAYNTDVLAPDELPESVFELTEPQWRGRVGWAPENGSFQAFVTAMRVTEGDDVTREWLEGMIANEPVVFANNTGAVEGVSRGEADVALVNHYYLYRFLAEDPNFNVANHYLPDDIGGLVNIAGIGVLDTSSNQPAAFALIEFLLGEDVQNYFGNAADALEFPLRSGVNSPELPALDSLGAPAVDLNALDDLQATLEMLQAVGAFE